LALFLIVCIASADEVTPPASITNLDNETSCNRINWTWTIPADDDYGGIMIYRNGAFVHNASGGTGSQWSGLTELTEYTLSTHTYDDYGNVNLTWVNKTTETTGCPPATDFVANDTTPCLWDVVQFTDTSTNTPTVWAWDIDGDYYDVPDPVRIFPAGLHSIELETCNAYGCDTELKVDYINATDCPAPLSPRDDCCDGGEDGSYALVFGTGSWLIASILVSRRRKKEDEL